MQTSLLRGSNKGFLKELKFTTRLKINNLFSKRKNKN